MSNLITYVFYRTDCDVYQCHVDILQVDVMTREIIALISFDFITKYYYPLRKHEDISISTLINSLVFGIKLKYKNVSIYYFINSVCYLIALNN